MNTGLIKTLGPLALAFALNGCATSPEPHPHQEGLGTCDIIIGDERQQHKGIDSSICQSIFEQAISGKGECESGAARLSIEGRIVLDYVLACPSNE